MQNVFVWMAVGTVAGGLAGWRRRRERGVTLAADLLTGAFGGVLSGWLVRRLGLDVPGARPAQIVVPLVGAVAVLAALVIVRQRLSMSGVADPRLPSPWHGLEDGWRRLGQLEQRIWQRVLARERSTGDPNQRFDAATTFGERVADRVARFGGSWPFIALFGLIVVGWMAVNEDLAQPFDAYPFILLNLVLSCLAALQAPVIMMSQNRQAAKDRFDAQSDYAVNLRAEMEILALHEKVDLLREKQWERLIGLVQQQQVLLEALARRLDVTLSPPDAGDGGGAS